MDAVVCHLYSPVGFRPSFSLCWMLVANDSKRNLSLGTVFTWREPVYSRTYPLLGYSPYALTDAWGQAHAPCFKAEQRSRAIPGPECPIVTAKAYYNYTVVWLFLLPNSLYFTHHNSCFQEHSLINPLYTDLRVAETMSRGNGHTTVYWLSYIFLCQLWVLSLVVVVAWDTVVPLVENNSVFFPCMGGW